MTWSLEQAYDVYPRIEEEFSAALDQSLHPRGPDLLFDLVARLGLAVGAVALDVGCGEGRQAVALHRRFGFRVTGIDPVPRHIEMARAADSQDGPAFTVGTAENLPPARALRPGLVPRRPGARPRPAARVRGIPPRAPARWSRARLSDVRIRAARAPRGRLAVGHHGRGAGQRRSRPYRGGHRGGGTADDEQLEIGSEWSEWAEEHYGGASRKLLHVSRLRRDRASYLERYGPAAYDMMLGDCLWHVYAMSGKLDRRVYLLSADEPGR